MRRFVLILLVLAACRTRARTCEELVSVADTHDRAATSSNQERAADDAVRALDAVTTSDKALASSVARYRATLVAEAAAERSLSAEISQLVDLRADAGRSAMLVVDFRRMMGDLLVLALACLGGRDPDCATFDGIGACYEASPDARLPELEPCTQKLENATFSTKARTEAARSLAPAVRAALGALEPSMTVSTLAAHLHDLGSAVTAVRSARGETDDRARDLRRTCGAAFD